MAEAIETMSQSELRAEVQRGRAAKAYARVKEKAASMQLVEKGTAVGSALAVGAATQYKPELGSALGGAGYLNPVLAVVGLGMLIATKGMAKEAGSGMFLAGIVPLANLVGGKIVEAATT